MKEAKKETRGRKRKPTIDKVKVTCVCMSSVQLDFFKKNGGSKLIQRLVDAEMCRIAR
jgi:hypothetical protein